MKIEYENTLEDMVAFAQYIYRNSPSMKRRTRILIIALPIILFIMIFSINITKETFFLNFSIWFILSLAWVLYILYLNKRSIIKTTRRLYSEGENKTIFGKHIIEVNPESLNEITEHSELITKWNSVNKIETDDNYIYIFISSVSAHVIPQKYFNSNLEIENFVKEVQYNIVNNKV